MKTTSYAGGSGQWWNGKGLVDGEVAGVTDDFGVALSGNNAAFGVGRPDTTIHSVNPINDGLWHHVAATRDSASGLMNLYLDGLWESGTNGPVGTKAAPPSLRIGSLQTGVAGGFFSGTIDDVQIFDRALSTAEIPSLMNHPPSLVPVPDTEILAGQTLLVTNMAADPDLPAQTLSFTLQSAPAGAANTGASGSATGRPAITHPNDSYPFQVLLADDGIPAQSATQYFNVTVLGTREARPCFLAPRKRVLSNERER